MKGGWGMASEDVVFERLRRISSEKYFTPPKTEVINVKGKRQLHGSIIGSNTIASIT